MPVRNKTAFSAAALAACALVFGAQQEATRDINKTLVLRAGQRLRVENKFGPVNVRGTSRGDVSVRATIRVAAEDRTQAEALMNEIRVEAESTADGARVATIYPDDSVRGGLFRRMRRNNISYSVSYEIEIPQSASLDVANAFGSIAASGLNAGVQISGANGAVRLDDSGGVATIENRFGAVDVGRHKGDVTIRNTNGAVTVTDAAGLVNVTNGFGAVRLTRIGKGTTVVNKNGEVILDDSGPANLSNSFAQVTARQVKGDLTVNSTNSAIDASSIAGAANLRTSFGKITLTHVGRHAYVVNQNGEIVVEDAASADLTTTFAPVVVRQVKGFLKVSSGNGAVNASSIGGSAAVQTSFGPVDLQSVNGEVTVTDNNGSVTVDNAGGKISVKNSFGSVNLKGARGPVSVQSQNGAVSAQLSGRGCQPADIQTSFAQVRLTLPETANYDVVASTSFGGIRSDFPLTMQGELNQSSVRGKLGQGGCSLQVTNRNGGIEFLKGR
ncbi:DUF4097 family beta strand repeat-containing protein [Paludibaculum fermentans]|uniref:Adhesin domain-containing protein n=1 Tax=Paludibaculum fermentans TaxID=1473598 RepID=A0A7S7SKI3_PALFE|nr:hypothetical protein [Paludibaculum fermentans]QOY87070.1 hypothetical protein IRI77_30535 [Paludibaculum fermentans]